MRGENLGVTTVNTPNKVIKTLVFLGFLRVFMTLFGRGWGDITAKRIEKAKQ
jgi:hypothetical protein